MISCAKQLNARIVVAGVRRRGRVFADRYHAKVLRSPTQVRNALRYVLNNWRRHGADGAARWRLDPFATGPQFAGWSDDPEPMIRFGPSLHLLPTAFPTTWLLTTGWKRAGGEISPYEQPGKDRHRP
jgi:hypothetical protein